MTSIDDKLNLFSRSILSTALACLTSLTACAHNFPSRTYDQMRSSIEIIDCSGPKLKVDDVDTIFCEDRTIRILGIDGAEVLHPKVGIYENQPFGPEGKAFAETTLIPAERVLVYVNKDINDGKDKYGRTLGHVLFGTKQHLDLYGVAVIQAGLAYQTITTYGDNGFPGYSSQLLDAAKNSPAPKFQNPHDWRKANQKKLTP